MTSPDPPPGLVPCPRCRTPLAAVLVAGGESVCPTCRGEVQLEAFPALVRPAPLPQGGETLTASGEASCFYHPRKKAAVICAVCGRFLCTLCEVEISGRSLCPACIESGRRSDGMAELVTERTLHDGIALSLAILPLLFFFATIVTAPIAIYYALRHWRSPGSILPRTRVRFAAAVVISLLQLAGWGAFLVKVL